MLDLNQLLAIQYTRRLLRDSEVLEEFSGKQELKKWISSDIRESLPESVAMKKFLRMNLDVTRLADQVWSNVESTHKRLRSGTHV